MTRYIVRTASARVPCKYGRYGRVAVLKVTGDVPVTQIREKRGVRIVCTWERRNIGRTSACAFEVARAEAQAMADRLNAEESARVSRILASQHAVLAMLEVAS